MIGKNIHILGQSSTLNNDRPSEDGRYGMADVASEFIRTKIIIVVPRFIWAKERNFVQLKLDATG